MKKICTKCQIQKEIFEFSKDKNTKSGFRSHCKKCLKEYYLLNKCKILDRQKNNYNVDKKKIYYDNNKLKYSINNKIYYDNNKKNILERKKENYNSELKKEYYNKNKKLINTKKAKYIIEKRKKDYLFKLKHNISSLIRNSIKRKGYIKSKKTEEIIGCDINFFIDYLSKKFKEGMSLENHGEWHIDHIIPISCAKTKEDIVVLNHYTNLQPLWAKDNLIKSNNETYESNN